MSIFDLVGNFIVDNPVSNYVYTTRLWNYLRRNDYGTDLCDFDIERGDVVISVGKECKLEEGDIICQHLVEYKYNGLIQSEWLQKHVILKMCKQTGYYLDGHFSRSEYLKEQLK